MDANSFADHASICGSAYASNVAFGDSPRHRAETTGSCPDFAKDIALHQITDRQITRSFRDCHRFACRCGKCVCRASSAANDSLAASEQEDQEIQSTNDTNALNAPMAAAEEQNDAANAATLQTEINAGM
jgi:hypothetical protein